MEGRISLNVGARVYEVQGSDSEPYSVTIVETDPGQPRALCTCKAGREGIACSHAHAALTLATMVSTRERAWEIARASLRSLSRIVEAEDTFEGEGGDEATRTALLETLDRFDDADNIDHPEGL
jgi:hypothetical protein